MKRVPSSAVLAIPVLTLLAGCPKKPVLMPTDQKSVDAASPQPGPPRSFGGPEGSNPEQGPPNKITPRGAGK